MSVQKESQMLSTFLTRSQVSDILQTLGSFYLAPGIAYYITIAKYKFLVTNQRPSSIIFFFLFTDPWIPGNRGPDNNDQVAALVTISISAWFAGDRSRGLGMGVCTMPFHPPLDITLFTLTHPFLPSLGSCLRQTARFDRDRSTVIVKGGLVILSEIRASSLVVVVVAVVVVVVVKQY
ncbi:hypothetical protein ElyMa_003659100 [Elysia marginata]|uniref:Uncharacterized protein n=1 Tax=Elysia marginata TaxID=1093978 RepID=A0AAV4EWN7_9GAST|nr:hypothetical protein ElyMa_003659100 [Elysia marginata]